MAAIDPRSFSPVNSGAVTIFEGQYKVFYENM